SLAHRPARPSAVAAAMSVAAAGSATLSQPTSHTHSVEEARTPAFTADANPSFEVRTTVRATSAAAVAAAAASTPAGPLCTTTTATSTPVRSWRRPRDTATAATAAANSVGSGSCATNTAVTEPAGRMPGRADDEAGRGTGACCCGPTW